MIDITEYEKTYKGKYKVRLYVNKIGYSSEIMTLSYHSAMGDDSYGTGAFNPAYVEFSLYTDNVIEAGQTVQLQLGAYKYEDVLDDEGNVIGQRDVTTMYQLGVFYCEKPVVDGNTVSVTAYDTLKYNFDGIYTTTITDDSTQTINIINDVCTQAGVQFLNQGGISTVEWQPSGFNGMSYRDVLTELANYNGLNVCTAPSGKVTMKSYRMTDFVYPASDCVDILISSDKIINGLNTYNVGSAKIFDFCPFLQAGDIITVGEYILPMVALSFDYETTCTAEIESKIRNDYENAPSVSERFDDVDEKVDEVNKKADKVEEASVEFSNVMNNAMGLFRIYQDGKTYYANTTKLDEATYIFTMTDAGFAWTDAWNGGNPTWTYGIDKDGNAIMRTLTAYKITADLIESGSIKGLNKSFADGNVVEIDLNNSKIAVLDQADGKETSLGTPTASGTLISNDRVEIGQCWYDEGGERFKEGYKMDTGFTIWDDYDGLTTGGKRVLFIGDFLNRLPVYIPKPVFGVWNNLENAADVTGTAKYKIIDDIVFLKGTLTFTKGSDTAYITKANDTIKPSSVRRWFAMVSAGTSGGTKIARCRIETDGKIGVEILKNLSDGTNATGEFYVDLTFSYSL